MAVFLFTLFYPFSWAKSLGKKLKSKGKEEADSSAVPPELIQTFIKLMANRSAIIANQSPKSGT